MVEVLKGLTPRLADSQSNLKPLAASAIAELASSLGTDAGTKVCIYYAGRPSLLRYHPIGSALLLTRSCSDVVQDYSGTPWSR